MAASAANIGVNWGMCWKNESFLALLYLNIYKHKLFTMVTTDCSTMYFPIRICPHSDVKTNKRKK